MAENDTSTMTPVQASNQSAALPGSSSGPSAGSPAGGAMAASGVQGAATTAAPVSAPIAPMSQPYSTMTTPTAVNVPNPRARPFNGPNPRIREDVVTSPAFGARGASEIQWTAQSRLSREQEDAVRSEAGRLGIAPSTLASVMAYETIGTFNPDIQGGTGGNYRGLIQFGPNERRAYGYRDGMSFEEQLAGPVHNYLVDRGLKPGMGVAEVYSIINAGSLRNGEPRWGASDKPGWNVRRHVDEITSTRLPEYQYLDEGWTPPRQEVDIPNPPMRPGDDSPALGAAGARSMPEIVPGSPSAAYGPLAAAEPSMGLPTVAGVVNTDGAFLVRGAKGDAAREWQQFLSDNGYTDAAGRPLTVDGDFGRRTKEATKQFQVASQIEADGIVGAETLSAALYVIDPASSPMPGQVAYTDGANAARKIIEPGAPDVEIPLPRARPERGAGVPNPPANPRRDPDGFMVDVQRPRIDNGDGSFSTEETATFEVNGEFINIPTIVDGKRLSPDQAYSAYEDGRNKPVQWGFKTEAEAVAAAQRRSDYIATARGTADERQPAPWSNVDEMTLVDENGNYVNQPPPEPPPTSRPSPSIPLRTDAAGEWYFGPADIGQAASDYRSSLLEAGGKAGAGMNAMVADYEQMLKASGRFRYASGWGPADIGREASRMRDQMRELGVPEGARLDSMVTDYERALKRAIAPAQRSGQAISAARSATRQRLSGLAPATDRFRPRSRRGGGETERVRTTEAVREYARGIADSYRRVVARSAAAPGGPPPAPAEQQRVADLAFRATPTPAETVTETYAFGRRT